MIIPPQRKAKRMISQNKLAIKIKNKDKKLNNQDIKLKNQDIKLKN